LGRSKRQQANAILLIKLFIRKRGVRSFFNITEYEAVRSASPFRFRRIADIPIVWESFGGWRVNA
jgi:hypothetical protein